MVMLYDFLQLDRKSRLPLYQQLYSSLLTALEKGGIHKGERLPSIRRLTEDLQISRTTVEAAYQQLCVEGYLRNIPKKGYFVLAEGGGSKAMPRPAAERHTARARYDLGTDRVDSRYSDIKIWRRQLREVLNTQESITSYGEPQGERNLRLQLSSYSHGARGVFAPPESIVVGAGLQPLLYLLCGLLGRERVAMEDRGFPQAQQVFSDCGVTCRVVPSDENGISIRALRESGAKIVFVRPSASVPGASAMPMPRRMELLAWARESGGLIIEDDYNGELRYTARPIPALQGLAGGGAVAYLGSFSKLLLPSVRVSYMVLPGSLLPAYRRRADRYNQTASKIEQLALAEYLKSGRLERHLRQLRKLYATKSASLLACMRSSFPGLSLTLQETSLYLSFPVTDSGARLLCAAAEAGGVRLRAQRDGSMAQILLGFSGIPLEEIPAAVQALKKAWPAELLARARAQRDA